MKEEILSHFENPEELEKIYRNNKSAFRKSFNLLFEDVKENPVARVWNERLNFEAEGISWGTKGDLVFVIVASVIAGLIAKFPDFASVSEEFYYPRNISFIVFPLMAAYFAWIRKLNPGTILIVFAVMIASAAYINLLPDNPDSHTLMLAYIHLPLILWSATGFTFSGGIRSDYLKRLNFLRFNGDLIVMTTVIVLSGLLLAGITLGLFTLIDINIEEIYFRYVGIWGLAASPILGTYLVKTNPQLVSNVSPVIARVFSPLVLITLVAYLVAIVATGKDPYNDRDFLMIFNLLLIGVMAIVIFSVAEISGSRFTTSLLLALAVVTIIVNGIALSAILFRISEWGISPNRLAVLGGNILILTNLLLVAYRLLKSLINKYETEKIGQSIAWFLPFYAIWAIVVTFLFPVFFNFR